MQKTEEPIGIQFIPCMQSAAKLPPIWIWGRRALPSKEVTHILRSVKATVQRNGKHRSCHFARQQSPLPCSRSYGQQPDCRTGRYGHRPACQMRLFRSGSSRGFISPSSGKCAERGRKGCGKCTYRSHRAWRCPNRIEAFAGDTEICSGKHCRSGYSDSLHRPFKQLITNCFSKKHPQKDYKHLEKELEQ